ncbi:hypothetical protein CBL_10904 [Carabus blaptoides fortunei]
MTDCHFFVYSLYDYTSAVRVTYAAETSLRTVTFDSFVVVLFGWQGCVAYCVLNLSGRLLVLPPAAGVGNCDKWQTSADIANELPSLTQTPDVVTCSHREAVCGYRRCDERRDVRNCGTHRGFINIALYHLGPATSPFVPAGNLLKTSTALAGLVARNFCPLYFCRWMKRAKPNPVKGIGNLI